jgi:steroid delta-isomerase-like uncharacterized protein
MKLARSNTCSALLMFGFVLSGCGGGNTTAKDSHDNASGGGASSSGSESKSSGGGGGGGGGEMAGKQVAAIHAMEAAFEANDAKKFGALFTDDVTLNVAGRPDVRGRAEAEKGFSYVTSTFGKAKFHARRIFTKGDTAIVEFTMTGTHEGAIDGVAPTHAAVGWNGAEVNKFAPDGRIKERRVYVDFATPILQSAKKSDARPIPSASGSADHIASSGAKDEENNVTLLDKINRAWESKDEAKWGAMLADDIEWDDFAMSKPAKGKDAVRAYFRIFSTAFPEITSNTVNAWGIGSFVIEEGSFSGIQKGPYLNIPPTSKLAAIYELNIVELSSGKIKRGWTYSNELDLREQLGVKVLDSKPPPKKK